MVEDAAGLDYIKDKVVKRTEEIIFHAEWEKSVLKSVSNRMNSCFCFFYVLLFQMPVSVVFGNSPPPSQASHP